jgi:hypothetical protein
MTIIKTLTNLSLAGALALGTLTASAAPAAADRRDVMRFVAGATALAIIANGLSQRQGHYGQHRTVEPHYDHRPRSRGVLPQHCRVTLREGHRTDSAYRSGCLGDAGFRHLPDHCETSVHTNHGWRSFYYEQCLINAGYDTARHYRH